MKVNFYFLTLILFASSLSARAQKFYVEPTEKGFEKDIVSKMRYDGYALTESQADADYKVECLVDGKYNAWAIKKMFHGYVRISDSKTGSEVARTKEVGKSPSAYNGFQAGPAIMSKIAKSELKKALDSVMADYKSKNQEGK